LRTERAFETLAALARDGKTNRAGAPNNPLLLALVLHEYEDEIYFVRPPLYVQRVIFGALISQAERSLPEGDVRPDAAQPVGNPPKIRRFHVRSERNTQDQNTRRT
jgi:hypothetical protein